MPVQTDDATAAAILEEGSVYAGPRYGRRRTDEKAYPAPDDLDRMGRPDYGAGADERRRETRESTGLDPFSVFQRDLKDESEILSVDEEIACCISRDSARERLMVLFVSEGYSPPKVAANKRNFWNYIGDAEPHLRGPAGRRLSTYTGRVSRLDEKLKNGKYMPNGRMKAVKAKRDEAREIAMAICAEHGILPNPRLLSYEQFWNYANESARGLGDDARRRADGLLKEIREMEDNLVRSCLRYAYKRARIHANWYESAMDMFSETSEGLLKAVHKFYHRRGRLTTIAHSWMDQVARRGKEHSLSRGFRLPSYVYDRISRIREAAELLEARGMHRPTPQEISKVTGVEESKVALLAGIDSMESASSIIPGEGKIDGHIIDFGPADTRERQPWEYMDDDGMKYVWMAMDRLDERERDIIERRYGLGDAPKQTLKEVGAYLGITRERVRQVQSDAMRKLKETALEIKRKEAAGKLAAQAPDATSSSCQPS